MSKKVLKSMDGNEAAAWASYAFTEVAGIYPITPSSPMAEFTDEWASNGMKNLFGMPVKIVEMQSEAGAAGTVHGSLQVGALTTTYTASQGLLLKIPNMYKIAGQLLPGVVHVSARSLAAQALSIFGDHQDVMACRQTGFAMLATGSVQEVMDLGGVAHLAAIKGRVPFLHFFDGFRTSHEVNTIEVMDYKVFDRLLDKKAVEAFRKNALNPNTPKTRGSAQNDDVYFQTRELQNTYYEAIPDIVASYMKEISKVTGRNYAPFVYYGAPDATDVVIAMGSSTEAIRETVDYLVAKGKKVGLLAVHLYRPFSVKYFLDQLPKTVKKIAVLDRTIEQGSIGEPLFLDVKAVFYGKENAPQIIGGRYGLSSKDTTPSMINAVFANLAGEMKDGFTVGIIDDITFKSLDVKEIIDVCDPETTELLFFGLGSDGTVGASKNTIKIIGENTNLRGQAYSSYDSKKSGGVTRMHLRFGKKPIRSTYLVSQPHFVSCSTDSYLDKYDMIKGLRNGGTFLLNTVVKPEEIEAFLPNKVKKQLAEKNAKLYLINAVELANKIGLGRRINTIMQSAFFKLSEQIMPYDEANKLMKVYAEKAYARKGDKVVKQNYDAIDAGKDGLIEIAVKKEWANLAVEAKAKKVGPDFVKNIASVVNAIEGDTLPMSVFKKYDDGHMVNGSSAYEKRGIANEVPVWVEHNCIQCNQCAFVCPHSCIRPFLVSEEEAKKAPKGATYLKPIGKGLENHQYTLQVSTLDCTGCAVCYNVCPAPKGKALELKPIHGELAKGSQKVADYFYNNVSYKTELTGTANVKNSQFAQPLFEFSGACAGCGETIYIKLLTQLFGDRVIIANATGCTSIYGGSYPATPFTTNKEGRGPAWANSLFEDNAEFGFGMQLAFETIRDRVQTIMNDNLDNMPADLKAACQNWIKVRNYGEECNVATKTLISALEGVKDEYAKTLLGLKQYFIKLSPWIIGGDGWAYDIGYGGLDHVIANNLDVNILVVDTEVYSNTGGQSSKAAREGSIAKFTAAGKADKKKDLAAIAMSYGHVYVGQVCHGASQAQMLKVFKEAEEFKGPSIIIAYSPCIAHGAKGGMEYSHEQSKLANQCGYWPIFRYDPRLEPQGKNPFQLDDPKAPNWDKYRDLLMSESRYSQLQIINPDHAEELLEANMKDARRRYKMYLRYQAMDFSNKD